jgi:hypothetical protein
VHQNLSVAPRAVVNKNLMIAIMDAAVCGLFVFPFNNYELLSFDGLKGTVYYRVEYVVVLLSFGKLSYPIRWVIDNTLDKFNNSLVLRKLAFFNPNSQYALKILIRNSPMKFIAMAWIFLLCLGAYVLRVAEAPPNANSMSYWQMLWLATVSSLTVGYGDVVPKSHIGRFVIVAQYFVCSFLLAISIVSITSFFELKTSERNVVRIHTHSQMVKALENGAASFLTKWLQLMIQKKKRRGKWSVELHWTVLEVVSKLYQIKRWQ